MKYIGTNCDMRLVEISDAHKILEFRLNSRLNKYLSPTENDINLQEEWILQYKGREVKGLEYYFLVLDKVGSSVGTIRLYNIDYTNKRFTIGSWIIMENSDPRISVESLLAAENYAYHYLDLEGNYFDVRKANKSVIRFHKKRGADLIAEDDLNYYFVLTRPSFDKYIKIIQDFISLGNFIM